MASKQQFDRINMPYAQSIWSYFFGVKVTYNRLIKMHFKLVRIHVLRCYCTELVRAFQLGSMANDACIDVFRHYVLSVHQACCACMSVCACICVCVSFHFGRFCCGRSPNSVHIQQPLRRPTKCKSRANENRPEMESIKIQSLRLITGAQYSK